MRCRVESLVLVALALCGCASRHAGVEPPTLKTLRDRPLAIPADPGIVADERQAIDAYRKFLDVAPHAPQQQEALRRLGDLEMDSADARSAAAGSAPDYRAAVARYEAFLKTYPNEPGNDRVLYQLARAQEQSGAFEAALATLARLVHDHPATAYRDEAQFRRGEMLFAMRDYVHAEQAYATVLSDGMRNPYQERALYMQGWSVFKQGRLEDALPSFFGVLDLKLAGRGDEGDLGRVAGLTRADRELVEDTFRVTSLCLANLQGAASIPAYITNDMRRGYEFRVYQQLGELYLKQERNKDAADTFSAYARRAPLHAQAPVMQARVIEIYQQAGFGNLALEAKKEYAANYAVNSEFRRANPIGWQDAQPLLKTNLAELAQHHHAAAQKTKSSADYQEAVRWYRTYLQSFPSDAQAAQNNFLLAELLYEDAHYAEAVVEYEKTAYDYPAHARAADAGYAALLAYAAQEKRAAADAVPPLQRNEVSSSLRFAAAFRDDARGAAVLTRAAEQLYALHDLEPAAEVAQQALARDASAAPALRRTAWTVIAHSAFERGAYARAEQAYAQVLSLAPNQDPARAELIERQAAAIYKQGEQARTAGRLRDAVTHFSRVASVAPASTVRAAAQYDAAAAMIGLKDWDAAARTLEDFRQRYPKHALQGEVNGKLAVIFLEQGRWAQAAGEFERLAAAQPDPERARDALWQAAELHEKAGARAAAAQAYEHYLQLKAQSLERAVEARYRLARLAKQDGNGARELGWMKDILQADQGGGAARTERTRYLGATAALALAEPVFEAYRRIALVEPLQKQLKLKKTKMEEVLKAYAMAADYGVAEVTTAATFHTASLYQDFGRALMSSQRPKRLSKAELEQYNVMLEEQAYPFEEKATELHELNARRAAGGLYDQWVQRSFAALKELRPLRYGKNEHAEEGVIDAIR